MAEHKIYDHSEKKERNEYMNRLTRISAGANGILVAIFLFITIIVLVPIILVVIISLSTVDSIAMNGYSFFPTEISFEAYNSLLFDGAGEQIWSSYIITIIHTAVGTVLSIFVSSLYGYGLAQKQFKYRKFYTYFLFVTMLFGGGLVPSYIVNTRYLGLYDSFWIYIFPSLIGAGTVIILRTFITTTIPAELLEAAKIDGADHFYSYFKIVLPLLKAGLAVIALWSVVGRWNDWGTAMLYIDNPKLIPLQTMLQRIQMNIDFIKKNTAIASSPEGREILLNLPSESTRMAIVIISTIPLLFAYPFFQRYFVKGIVVGSVKG